MGAFFTDCWGTILCRLNLLETNRFTYDENYVMFSDIFFVFRFFAYSHEHYFWFIIISNIKRHTVKTCHGKSSYSVVGFYISDDCLSFFRFLRHYIFIFLVFVTAYLITYIFYYNSLVVCNSPLLKRYLMEIRGYWNSSCHRPLLALFFFYEALSM